MTKKLLKKHLGTLLFFALTVLISCENSTIQAGESFDVITEKENVKIGKEDTSVKDKKTDKDDATAGDDVKKEDAGKDKDVTSSSDNDLAIDLNPESFYEIVVRTPDQVYNAYHDRGYNLGEKGPVLITEGRLFTGKDSKKDYQDIFFIWLSGTESVDGQDTNVVSTDKNAYSDKSTNYLKSVLRAIRTEIPKGSSLIFAGHSLGGMIAQQAAGYKFIKENYSVLKVLTFGAPPVGSVRTDGKVTRFVDSSDVVPMLSYEYINGYVDPKDIAISKDGEYGGDKFESHSKSYGRNDLWGMYDVLGVEKGFARLGLNISETKYFKAPSKFETTGDNSSAAGSSEISTGGKENFVLIKAKGKSFQMGNSNGSSTYREDPVHKVTLTRNYYMCTRELTQGEYFDLIGKNNSVFKDPDSVADNRLLPVEYCSWYDALYYCNKRSLKENLKPCYTVNDEPDPEKWNYIPNEGKTIYGNIKCDFESDGYRLPTEAEWEYAARGKNTGTDKIIISGGAEIEKSKYNSHSTAEDKEIFIRFNEELSNFAWTYDHLTNSTHEVKMLSPNEFGLYDMSGNVAEWCWDKWGQYDDKDQTDPDTGNSFTYAGNRVVRGGTYYLYSSDCSVTARCYAGADYRYYSGGWSYGFRVVRTAK